MHIRVEVTGNRLRDGIIVVQVLLILVLEVRLVDDDTRALLHQHVGRVLPIEEVTDVSIHVLRVVKVVW